MPLDLYVLAFGSVNNVFAAFSSIVKNEVKLITKTLSFFLKK